MKKTELDAWLREQIDAFPGKVSLLMTDLINGRHYHSFDADTQVVSASTIKVPILLYALEQVRQKRLSLEQAGAPSSPTISRRRLWICSAASGATTPSCATSPSP